MVNVVGVRFKKAGKIYYFDPDGLDIELKTDVLVETARGIEFGNVIIANREVDEEQIVSPLKKVIRLASEDDKIKHQDNKKKEREALEICIKKIRLHKLDMKLVDAEYTFDNNKVLFYFTADGRVDFRELVKDLAAVFRTRIELRQIGVRDEAKIFGGIGICGLVLCCKSYLAEFHPVSIKMAKEQGLSLNPSKISGICGRLMCCLKYEQEAYEDAAKRVPKVGAVVETPDGIGTVWFVSLLKEIVKVKMEIKGQDSAIREFKASTLKVIKDVERDDSEVEIDIAALKKLED